MGFFKIRREHLFLWIFGWIVYIDYLTGMKFTFILFLLPLLFVIKLRKRWILVLFVIRLCFLPSGDSVFVEGEMRIYPLSPFDSRSVVLIEGKKFLLEKSFEPSMINATARIEPFSKRREGIYSSYDFWSAKGFYGRVELLEIRDKVQIEDAFRNKILRKLYKRSSVFGEQRDLAFSLMLGSKETLSFDERQTLLELGIMHLFVLSGLHFGIYERGLKKILSFLWIPRPIVSGILVFSFSFLVFLTSFHPSALRFFLLFVLKEWDFYRQVDRDPWERFCMTGWLILLFEPGFATGLSYSLGMIAHGSLLYFKKYRILKLYAVLLPFQLFFYGHFSPLFIIFNLFLVLLMPLLLMILWLAYLIQPISFLAQTLLLGIKFIMRVLQMHPVLKLTIFKLSPLCFSLIILGYMLSLLRLQNAHLHALFIEHKRSFLIILIALIVLAQSFHLNHLQQGMHLLDVGQGDSMVFFTEKGRVVMIDTGSSKRVLEDLRYLGIDEVDILIITHRDRDHSGQKDAIKAKKRYTSLYTPFNGAIPLREGDLLKLDDLSFMVLSPESKRRDENDNSLVLAVEQKGVDFLLCGDVSGILFKEEWTQGIEIFKFSHHGSIHSLKEEAMEDFYPSVLLLSYGENDYGHPSKEVLEFFLERSSVIFETKKEGSFHLWQRFWQGY